MCTKPRFRTKLHSSEVLSFFCCIRPRLKWLTRWLSGVLKPLWLDDDVHGRSLRAAPSLCRKSATTHVPDVSDEVLKFSAPTLFLWKRVHELYCAKWA